MPQGPDSFIILAVPSAEIFYTTASSHGRSLSETCLQLLASIDDGSKTTALQDSKMIIFGLAVRVILFNSFYILLSAWKICSGSEYDDAATSCIRELMKNKLGENFRPFFFFYVLFPSLVLFRFVSFFFFWVSYSLCQAI